jgi:hypothetical protein
MLAAATTTALFEADIGRSLLLSSATVAGAPPIIYALLAFTLLRGAPLGRRLGWAVAACGVYTALGLLSGVTLALAHPMSLEGALRRSLWSFAPAPFVHLLAAPLVLLAWRSRLIPLRFSVHGESRAAAPSSARATGPTSPDWDSILHVSTPVPWMSGTNSTATERASRERDAVPETPAPRERAPAPRPRPTPASVTPVADVAPPLVAAPVAPTPMVAAPTPVTLAPSSTTSPARPTVRVSTPEAASSVPVAPMPKPAAPAPARPRPSVKPAPTPAPASSSEQEPVIRVPFDRIADQLPPDVFTLPAARLAESLQEPHVLLVPRRLVLPQLGEGAVEVAWTLVEGQFPELAFAMPPAEVRRRFPEWVLSLPMDVVVSQVPMDLFRMEGPTADLSGIGEFPAPFTPGPLEPEAAAPSDPPPAPESKPAPPPPPVVSAPSTPPVVSAPTVRAPGAAKPAETPVRAPRATIAPASKKPPAPEPLTTHQDVAVDIPEVLFAPEVPSNPVASAVPPVPAIPRIPTASPAPVREVVPPAAARTVVTAPVPKPAVAAAERTISASPPIAVAPLPSSDDEGEALAQALAPGLAPLGTFDWQARRAGDRPLVCFVPPVLSREPIDTLAVGAAGLVQRLTSWGVEQLTVRTARLACVLTPLGARGCLAATVERGGSVAMLELLSTRAARAIGHVTGGGTAPIAFAAVGTVPAAGGAGHRSVAEAARALTAFGAIAASVVEAEGTAPGVYVFAGRDQAVLAGAARAVYDALVPVHDEDALGTLESVVLRRGRERVVVRPLRRSAGAPAVLATAGEVTLAGRAHRAAAQAAAALEAR